MVIPISSVPFPGSYFVRARSWRGARLAGRAVEASAAASVQGVQGAMESLATIAEVFRNASVPQQPQLAEFGLCYVAFVGEHERRYRGERLLQIAAQQASAAAMAHDISLRQCLITDQPERRRPYIQDIIPLLSSADAAPFLSRCDEYTRRFSRPCKLYFGYMAKVSCPDFNVGLCGYPALL
eukprot:6175781-Pleurochrysis_carterae.AAC.1